MRLVHHKAVRRVLMREITIDLIKGDWQEGRSFDRLRRFMIFLLDIQMGVDAEPIFWLTESNCCFQYTEGASGVCIQEEGVVHVTIFDTGKNLDVDEVVAYCVQFWKAKSETHSVRDRKATGPVVADSLSN